MKRKRAVLGGGCFWCLEAIFSRLKGVEGIVPGYAGGTIEDPNYNQVSTGKTGHVEVVEVTFNSDLISYDDLLQVFFSSHDPTQVNRQGTDIGCQYRSVIFYSNKEQKDKAINYIGELQRKKIFPAPIVTEVSPLKKFYSAEKYHVNYYENNPQSLYCQLFISPKIRKLRKTYEYLLK